MLPSTIFGEKGKDVIVMLAGFPDDTLSGWGASNIESMAKEYRVICLCLPGYDNPKENIKAWGWDLPEIMDMLHTTIEYHIAEEGASSYNLIVHDWGAFFGLCYQNVHPERIKRLVLFDIGVVTKPPLMDMLRIVFYQWYFALTYAISQLLSKFIAKMILLFFFLFISWTPLAPCPWDKPPRNRNEVDVQQCYPYWYFWFGKHGYLRLGPKKMLRPVFPTCPTFFAYGKKKNVMFHGKSFEDRLHKTDGCRVRAYDCGHWILTSVERPTVLIDIMQFLGAK